jgi:hypothetical protein
MGSQSSKEMWMHKPIPTQEAISNG